MQTGETQLMGLLSERVGDALRSIIYYDLEDYEVAYLRDDVAELHSAAELDEAVQEARFESIEAPMYEGLYSPNHGTLVSQVKWYEHVVQLNFVTGERQGVTVSLDTHTLEEFPELIEDLRESL